MSTIIPVFRVWTGGSIDEPGQLEGILKKKIWSFIKTEWTELKKNKVALLVLLILLIFYLIVAEFFFKSEHPKKEAPLRARSKSCQKRI